MLKRLMMVGAFSFALSFANGQNRSVGMNEKPADNVPDSAVTIVDNSLREQSVDSITKEPREADTAIQLSNWALVVIGGITGWAVWLQARDTRKAAEATLTQAAISREALVVQFRPRVVVRSLKLNPSSEIYYLRRKDRGWKVEIVLFNAGGTVAHVHTCQAFFQMIGSKGEWLDDLGHEYWDHQFDLPPGKRHSLNLILDAENFRTKFHGVEATYRLNRRQMRFPTCFGTISYKDDNGFERETGFFREWSMDRKQFIVADDDAHEYQD
jgi:hypothetical protein